METGCRRPRDGPRLLDGARRDLLRGNNTNDTNTNHTTATTTTNNDNNNYNNSKY